MERLLSRRHLFEFEDLVWFPRRLRDMVTDFLTVSISAAQIYDPAAEIVGKLVRDTGITRIIDLCSGGGGPAIDLARRLRRTSDIDVHVLLTDKFPNERATQRLHRIDPERVEISPRPVDALDVPGECDGIRTLFTSFHHFAPTQAQAILRAATTDRAPIAIFEVTERTLFGMASALVLGPFSLLLLTPFVRPFRLDRLVFTYLIPVVPLVLIWDGVASSLRSYSPDELLELTEDPALTGYTWSSGRRRSWKGYAMTYLIGQPNDNTI